jgi:hypothetical protein
MTEPGLEKVTRKLLRKIIEMREDSGKPEELLHSLEGHLQTSLHPVAPDPEFIRKLRTRLVEPTPPILEKETGIMSLLVILFGLLSGIAVLFLGKRAIVIIAAGVGLMINRWKKKNTPISI